MKLALNLPQFMDYKAVQERTLLAERLGYHSVWLQDHLWQLRIPEADHPEAIATMAARTSRICSRHIREMGHRNRPSPRVLEPRACISMDSGGASDKSSRIIDRQRRLSH